MNYLKEFVEPSYIHESLLWVYVVRAKLISEVQESQSNGYHIYRECMVLLLWFRTRDV